ncbi:MAG: hypothetical protein NTZ56_19460 [Acidobacteria bacterium]|nr:hypothetical protein [Acidobacteriota bacterium]
MTWCYILLAIPAAYQLLVIVAAIRFLRHRHPASGASVDWPAVSILKPSAQGELPPAAALRTHLDQDYPGTVELLSSTDDPLPVANRKVGKLMRLAGQAHYATWILNDADIEVPRDYVRTVIRTLMEPGVGLVTCLYRAHGDSTPSRFEALGIATDFMPSVLVARLIGIREFGLGATLAFRRGDLDRSGGLAVVADYIADDYQLAKGITHLGLRAELAPTVVQTHVHGNWRQVWQHQVRWARTIRCSRTVGFAGLPLAQAGVWLLAAVLMGADMRLAGALLGLRWLSAWVGGVMVLDCPVARRRWWLTPAWDVFAFAVWVAGWTGRSAVWRDQRITLDNHGRIVESVTR